VRCAEPDCRRAAEVVIHVDGLRIVACFGDGVRLARGVGGRVVLLRKTLQPKVRGA